MQVKGVKFPFNSQLNKTHFRIICFLLSFYYSHECLVFSTKYRSQKHLLELNIVKKLAKCASRHEGYMQDSY